jgi:hypothetical protein
MAFRPGYYRNAQDILVMPVMGQRLVRPGMTLGGHFPSGENNE